MQMGMHTHRGYFILPFNIYCYHKVYKVHSSQACIFDEVILEWSCFQAFVNFKVYLEYLDILLLQYFLSF